MATVVRGQENPATIAGFAFLGGLARGQVQNLQIEKAQMQARKMKTFEEEMERRTIELRSELRQREEDIAYERASAQSTDAIRKAQSEAQYLDDFTRLNFDFERMEAHANTLDPQEWRLMLRQAWTKSPLRLAPGAQARFERAMAERDPTTGQPYDDVSLLNQIRMEFSPLPDWAPEEEKAAPLKTVMVDGVPYQLVQQEDGTWAAQEIPGLPTAPGEPATENIPPNDPRADEAALLVPRKADGSYDVTQAQLAIIQRKAVTGNITGQDIGKQLVAMRSAEPAWMVSAEDYTAATGDTYPKEPKLFTRRSKEKPYAERPFSDLSPDDQRAVAKYEIQRLRTLAQQTSTATAAPPPPTAAGAQVRVIAPDGSQGWIPAEDLAEALREGYRKAD